MQVSIFVLNLGRHKTYAKYGMQVIRYIDELADFIEFYLKQRYNVEAHAGIFWPAHFVPKTYKEVQEIDRYGWVDKYFGQGMQIYLGYGLDLQPHEDKRTAEFNKTVNVGGYCECLKLDNDGKRKTGDMLYSDMMSWSGVPPLLRNLSIYTYYSELSRIVTHEIDHEINRKNGEPYSVWLEGVHKAKKMPLLYWRKPFAMPQGLLTLTSAPYFVSQVDPRTV